MGIQDLIITPIYLILFTILAYVIRPYVTNKETKKYFIPALWVKFIGAIALGLVYQFYYSGGDTFNYWEHGSKWVYLAFQEDFVAGIQLLLEAGGERQVDTFQYSQFIWYYRDQNSYLIVRIAALFDLFTFHTYSATALFFAVFSFSGLWAMYSILQVKYHESIRRLAIAILFIPSVIFWGSGILKDTVTLGALGWMVWSLLRLIELNRRSIIEIVILLISFYLIFSIKKYILICFIPMIAVWMFLKYLKRAKNIVIKILTVPVLSVLFGVSGFAALQQITLEDSKYELGDLAERARITAYDIRYGWGARTGGDGGYDIGLPDGTWQGMLKLMPAAVNVSLFRPYLWEVRNPLMLLSAFEATIIIIFTFQYLRKGGVNTLSKDPFLIFCLGFSLLFAFAVGISTFNFGTLMRYKIPMIVFFATTLAVIKK